LKIAIELLQTFTEDKQSQTFGIRYLQTNLQSYEGGKGLQREQICEALDANRSLIENTSEI
jgi:vacuolar protein sorting-associated protein 13A/C